VRHLFVVFIGALSLLTGPAWGWSNHGLATYWAFASMPEVANAKPVTVEPIEALLRKEEPAIEALLVAQEDWARANLSNYPPRPADFKADAARDDHTDRRFWKRCALPPTSSSRCSSSPIHRRGSILHECWHTQQSARFPSRPLPSSVLAGSTRATLLRRYPFSPRLRMSHSARHQLLGGQSLGVGQTLSLRDAAVRRPVGEHFNAGPVPHELRQSDGRKHRRGSDRRQVAAEGGTQAMQVESPGHKSREAKLIKLVDQTSNLRAISFSQRRIGRSNVV
jgi:hypothetical protein